MSIEEALRSPEQKVDVENVSTNELKDSLTSYIEEIISSTEHEHSAELINERKLSRDVAFVLKGIENNLFATNPLEKRDLSDYVDIFSNLEDHLDAFQGLTNITKRDLLKLQTDIYTILHPEFDRNFKQSAKIMQFEANGGLYEPNGIKLAQNGNEWQVFGGDSDKVSHVIKDGKKFIFDPPPCNEEVFDYLLTWMKLENTIHEFNLKAAPQYKTGNVNKITILGPGIWRFKKGNRLYIATGRDVLLKENGRIFDPFNPRRKISISRPNDSEWNDFEINYQERGKRIVRKLSGFRDTSEEKYINENGQKIIVSSTLFLLTKDNREEIQHFEVDENGEKREIQYVVGKALYGHNYKISRDEYREITALSLGEENIRLLEVSPQADQAEKERLAELYLQELAEKLKSPEELAIFIKTFFQYTHDSPNPVANPYEEGTEEDKGQYTQSAIETVLRQKGGQLLGDCDDYAVFAREILIRNENVAFVHLLGVPRHATCLWAEKTENGYTLCTLGTGGLFKSEAETIEDAYSQIADRFGRGGLLGVAENTEVNIDEPTIEIFYNLRGLETDRLSIPKGWLSPKSEEGGIFFKLTLAHDENNNAKILQYAELLLKSIESGADSAGIMKEDILKFKRLAFSAALALGEDVKAMEFFDIKSPSFYENLAELLQKRDFSNEIIDGLFKTPGLDSNLLQNGFTGLITKLDGEKGANCLMYYFKLLVQTVPQGQIYKRIYTSFSYFLRGVQQPEKAFWVLKQNPDYVFIDALTLFRSLDSKLVLQEMPKDVNQIPAEHLARSLRVYQRFDENLSNQLSKRIGTLIDDGAFKPGFYADMNYLINFYEERGDINRTHALLRVQLNLLKTEVELTAQAEEIDYSEALVGYFYDSFFDIYSKLGETEELAKLKKMEEMAGVG
jgi:hypothetical protein